MTFPFFFKPVWKDGVPLFDGGIYDNFPVDVMKSDFDRQPYTAPICNALDMETDSELFVCTSIMASTDEQSSHDVDIKV